MCLTQSFLTDNFRIMSSHHNSDSPQLVESSLGDAGYGRGDGEDEGGGSHGGVDGDHGRPEPRGRLAAEKQKEGEDSSQELQ